MVDSVISTGTLWTDGGDKRQPPAIPSSPPPLALLTLSPTSAAAGADVTVTNEDDIKVGETFLPEIPQEQRSQIKVLLRERLALLMKGYEAARRNTAIMYMRSERSELNLRMTQVHERAGRRFFGSNQHRRHYTAPTSLVVHSLSFAVSSRRGVLFQCFVCTAHLVVVSVGKTRRHFGCVWILRDKETNAGRGVTLVDACGSLALCVCLVFLPVPHSWTAMIPVVHGCYGLKILVLGSPPKLRMIFWGTNLHYLGREPVPLCRGDLSLGQGILWLSVGSHVAVHVESIIRRNEHL